MAQVFAWSNGGYSDDPLNPDYGTHDWIAQRALDWLPLSEKAYIEDYLVTYLYGTELPDNGGAIDGIGDSTKHHIYYFSNGTLYDDAAAVRAYEEYNRTLSYLDANDFENAAKYAGIMSHYIVDMAVFGHVMGASTDWGTEEHHSDYENYVNTRTNSYTDDFDVYLTYDGSLDLINAYDAAVTLAYDTTFDVNGDLTCVWMDQNYDWNNSTFAGRSGESLNWAVNYLADVLHTLYLSHNSPVANDDWPMFQHDLNHTGYTTSNGPTTNNTLWTYPLSSDVSYSSTAISSGLIYISTGGSVYCFNETRGTLEWITSIDSSSGDSSPAVFSGRLYVGGNVMVYCLNASTGSQLWTYTTEGGVWSSPVIYDSHVFFGSDNRNIYCLNAYTGTKIWNYTTGGYVRSSAAIANGRVYMGSYDGHVYCLDAITGVKIWNTSYIGCKRSSPTIVNGNLFIGAAAYDYEPIYDIGLYCFNATTGALNWQSTNVAASTSSPAIVNDRVYICDRKNYLLCLNATTGNIIWSRYLQKEAGIASSPGLASGYVYTASYAPGIVYCLDANDGRHIWNYSAGSKIFSSPSIRNGRAYIGTSGLSPGAQFYCFGILEDSVNFVTKDAYGKILARCNVTIEGVSSAVSDANGWISFRGLSPGTYSVTARWQEGIVNQTTITVPMLQISIDINCQVYYSLTIEPTFYDNIGSPLTPSPVEWTIQFPNGTAFTVSSTRTYSQIQEGIYRITSITWKGMEVVPAVYPSIQLSTIYDVEWTPSINCQLPTNLFSSLSSSTSFLGFHVKINGNLTYNKVGVSKAPVLLSYSVTDGASWNDITLVNTISIGEYSAEWMPVATGYYLVRAMWAGNATFPGSSRMVNLAVTPFEETTVFAVVSNSTISELEFKPSSRKLSFTVSGPSGTTGFIDLTIAKTLVADVMDLRVYLNGTETGYTVSSTDDAWILSFTYAHSTHQVVIDIADRTPPTVSFTAPTEGAVVRSPQLTISWIGSDVVVGIDYFEVKLNGGEWMNVGSQTSYAFNELSEGIHTVSVKAYDHSGNSKEYSITFTVNTSLIGGPGWTDDMAVLGGIGIIALVGLIVVMRWKKSNQL